MGLEEFFTNKEKTKDGKVDIDTPAFLVLLGIFTLVAVDIRTRQKAKAATLRYGDSKPGEVHLYARNGASSITATFEEAVKPK